MIDFQGVLNQFFRQVIETEAPVLAFLYIFLALGVIGGCWLFFDIRDQRRAREDRESTVFHCIHCEHIYMRRRRRDVARCPKCGKDNLRLRF